MEGKERGGRGRRGIARTSPAFNSINRMLQQNRGEGSSHPGSVPRSQANVNPEKENGHSPGSRRVPQISDPEERSNQNTGPDPETVPRAQQYSQRNSSLRKDKLEDKEYSHDEVARNSPRSNSRQGSNGSLNNSGPLYRNPYHEDRRKAPHSSQPERKSRPGLDENTLRKYFLSESPTRFGTKRIIESVMEYADSLEDDDEGWEELVDGWIVEAALVKGYSFMDLALELMLQLIGIPCFMEAGRESIMRRTGEVMRGSSEETETKQLPRLMGRLLVAPWPRPFNSCAKEVNPILFAVLSIVQGWLEILKKPEKHEADTVQTCCDLLAHLSFAAGRKLWLQWPETIDGIYSVLRSLIVNPNDLDASTKSRLLDLYVKLKEWTKPSEGRKPAVYSVEVQTTDSRHKK